MTINKRIKIERWIALAISFFLVMELISGPLGDAFSFETQASQIDEFGETSETDETLTQNNGQLGEGDTDPTDNSNMGGNTNPEEDADSEEKTEDEIKPEDEEKQEDENNILPESIFSTSIIPYAANLGNSNIPSSAEGLGNVGTIYRITSYQDWINLEALSQTSTLEGYEFIIDRRITDGSSVANYDLTFTGIDTEESFDGLGSSAYPFAGTLYVSDIGGIPLTINKPLFQYLSTKANIHHLSLNPQGDICAGVAEYLIIQNEAFAGFNNISVNEGTGIQNVNDVAGGLFANVVNNTGETFTLQGTNVVVNSYVTGNIAGGLIGKLTGKVTLVLDGGIKWSPCTMATSTDATKPAVSGGLIGVIGDGVTTTELTITGNEIIFAEVSDKSAESKSNEYVEDMGGIFGSISRATVNITKAISYTGTTGTGADLCGMNAGVFAGQIENAIINLNAPFTVNGVTIHQRENDGTTNGIGGFVGKMSGSQLNAATVVAPIVLNTIKVTYAGSGTPTYNIGGFIGYVKNSNILLSENSFCKVTNFSSTNTYGNVAGGIGYYEADSSVSGAVLSYLAVTGETVASAKNGNAAGLIAYMSMSDCNVFVEKCYVGEGGFLTYLATNNVSLGIGAAYGTEATLNISGVVVDGRIRRIDTTILTPVVGGLIGTVDVDLKISGNVNDAGVFDTAVRLGYYSQHIYNRVIAGLIGEICQSGNAYRKIDISNVLVGDYGYNSGVLPYRYGGLLGVVDNKTSVCLDGKIHMNGGNAIQWNGTARAVQALNPDVAGTYFATVVAEQNYSLIYLQPTAELVKSANFFADEVGNYGGIFRNGNWDGEISEVTGLPVDNSDPSAWLIYEHEVNGTWKYYQYDSETGQNILQIETMGDWMRLALYGNTAYMDPSTYEYSGFYPLEVFVVANGSKTEYTKDTVYWTVRTSNFYIASGTYDLSKCGIVSLYRNEQNISVLHSFYGESNDVPIIKNSVTTYMQSYIGLFPTVNGSTDSKPNVNFENLHIEYDVTLDKIRYFNANYVSDRNVTQIVGQLSAAMLNNVNITNVSYSGTVKDNKQCSNPSYIGGIAGVYVGIDGAILDISNVTTYMDYLYSRANARAGGLLAFVSAPETGSFNVSIDGVKLGGTIIGNNATEDSYLMHSALITEIAGNSSRTGMSAILKVSNITTGALKLSAGNTSIAYSQMGGFLGFSWNCCDVTLENITIGTENSAEILGNGNFGGLVHNVRGKMTVKNVTYGANTVIDVIGNKPVYSCGLLVRDGQNLYLNIDGYTIEDGVTIKNYSHYFDEIVGFNKGGDGANEDRGGIVSINTGDSLHLGREGAYHSYDYASGMIYENCSGGILKKNNVSTRYYYDLDQLDYTIDYSKLDSQNAVMVWHIMHYANDYVRDYCLTDTPAHTSIPTQYTISGEIDMRGYSIYPTSLSQGESYQGTNGAKIIFDAQSIYAGEEQLYSANNEFVIKRPYDNLRQHYKMHAGLFGNLYSGIEVDGLTLSGNYSSFIGSGEQVAGALVAGNICGVALDEKDEQGHTLFDENVEYKFTNISMEDLWCVYGSSRTNKYDAFLNQPLGLMISKVAAGANVVMNGISMKGYEGVDYNSDGTTDYKAASSLIGIVGDGNATYISVLLKNMDIMDAAEGKSSTDLNSTVAEEALAKSSLIYRYDYSENCSVIYTFTAEDYMIGKIPKTGDVTANVVTLGLELGDKEYPEYSNTNYANIEYYDMDVPVGKATEEGYNEIVYASTNYLPYVYTGEREMMVNPKVESITLGCGTYEDPYQISTALQLVSLYRYLYDEKTYEEVFAIEDEDGNTWQIHATGNGTDAIQCDGTEASHGGLLNYKESNFPTQEQLSQAYYLITDDLDLSEYSEFVGFGRENQPFVGVFVGRKIDDSKPKITLSKQSEIGSLSCYAFIQVAKGAVVKDLTLEFPATINIGSTAGESIGAGVIATVIGGENIIDGVTVRSKDAGAASFQVKDLLQDNTGSGNDTEDATQQPVTIIGGYVGVVELGGVLLRDVNFGNLQNFRVKLPENTSLEEYPFVAKMVGNVLDGYVVYDGGLDKEHALLENSTILIGAVYDDGLSLCNTYDILNGGYLEATMSKIGWNGNTYTIADNKQLQVMSMALNSGMLNYNNGTDNRGVGYNAVSRQRNGDYSLVGKTADINFATIYEDIRKNDNCGIFTSDRYYDSYLVQFFDSQKSYMLNANRSASVMNPTLKSSDSSALTYSLTGTEYDMSVFLKGFRGFGARYHGTEYSQTYANEKYYDGTKQVVDPTLLFQSNLIGTSVENPVTIILNMKVTEAMDSTRAGLLNEIPNGKSGTKLRIENIVLTGAVINEGSDITYDDTEECWISNADYNAGGFASDVITNIGFTNVTLKELEVDATGDAGGLIGSVSEAWTSNITCQNINIDTLSVIAGIELDIVGITTGNAGGLIGKMKAGGYGGSKIYIGTDADLKKDTYKGVNGKGISVTTRGNDSAAGGIIGYLNGRNGYAIRSYIYHTILTDLSVCTNNRYAGTGAYAGGIIGQGIIINTEMYDIAIGSRTEGEHVEILLKWDNDTTTNGLVPSEELNPKCGAGGFIGYASIGNVGLNFTNCQILGVNENGTSTTIIKGYGRTGGIVGKTEYVGLGGGININTSNVDGIDVQGLNYIGGFISELNVYNTTIQKSSVQNSNLYSYGMSDNVDNSVGGFVGCVGSPIHILTTESIMNQVKNNYISGDIVGGVLGEVKYQGAQIGGIEISENKIITCVTASHDQASSRKLAGGLAGKIKTGGVFYAENIIISDNLIAGYKEDGNYMGGVLGTGDLDAYFYHMQLKDNYIGFLTINKSQNIINEPIDKLRDMLYVRYRDTVIPMKDIDIEDEDVYFSTYHLGLITGRKHNYGKRTNYFIDINIQYTDNKYRPISEVGLSGAESGTVKSYSDVRETYRDLYFIVYDSMDTEYPVTEEDYAGFTNVEKIYEDYANAETDKRYAYKLDSNYINGALSDVSMMEVYKHTFHNGESYVSEFKSDTGEVIPMVTIRSSAMGTLDEVIQSYINMLTNNSGGISTYTGQDIVVTTKAMKLVNGVITENGDENAIATVQATEITEGSNRYTFANQFGENSLYDVFTDEKNATFTLVTVEYQYDGETKWLLEIPVYIEQRLEYNTHMRFVEGIEHNVSTIKNGQYTAMSGEEKAAFALDAGASYSLYLEYVYGETRTHYRGQFVPKIIAMDSEYSISFLEGTQMTLIDMEDNGKPYYYEVTAEDGNTINFEKFSDSSGNNYKAKYFNETDEVADSSQKCTYMDSFVDVCQMEKTNVTVERYVLLVDTSNLGHISREASYDIRTIFAENQQEEESYKWIDHLEHCTVMIAERTGMGSDFVTEQTSVSADSMISDNGQITLTMTYDITLDGSWLAVNANTPRYFDIAIGLTKQTGGESYDIPLPAGTRIFFEAPRVDVAGNTIYETIATSVIQGQDTSKVYYFQNCGIKNVMEMQAGTTREMVRVTLDFIGADLSLIEDEEQDAIYHISADLIETMDASAPERGVVKDSYSGAVGLSVLSDIDIVLSTKDIMSLGINRFSQESVNEIPFTAQIAFPNEGYNNGELAEKYYSIVFAIEEKIVQRNTQTGVMETIYVPYEYDVDQGSKINIKYTGASNSADMNTVTPVDTIITDMTMQFKDFPAIRNNHVRELSFTVEVGENVEFSNYRIRAYLVVSDSEPEEDWVPAISNELQNDFFIFTVAKIKTDLE